MARMARMGGAGDCGRETRDPGLLGFVVAALGGRGAVNARTGPTGTGCRQTKSAPAPKDRRASRLWSVVSLRATLVCSLLSIVYSL